MGLISLRISDSQRQRWAIYTRAAGMTLTALVKASVDERIAANTALADAADATGLDGAKISVTHGDQIVVVSTIRPDTAAVWAGTPAAARELAAMLLHQARTAEVGRTSQ